MQACGDRARGQVSEEYLALSQWMHLGLLLHDLLTWPTLKQEKQMRALDTYGETEYLQLYKSK